MGRILNLLDKRGFTLVEALVSVAIVSISALAATQIVLLINRSAHEARFRSTMTEVYRYASAISAHPDAWDRTTQRNSEMACLRTKSCTNQANFIPIDLLDMAGTAVIRTKSPSAGFTYTGEPCDSFDARQGMGNDQCPIRFTIAWRTSCNTNATVNSCLSPQEHLDIQAQYNPSSNSPRFAFNSQLTSGTVVRQSSELDNPVASCAREQKVFIGVGARYRGNRADEKGCVERSAFAGNQGNGGNGNPTNQPESPR